MRRAQDHDATLSIKTEFMQHWDGLLTDTDVRSSPGCRQTPDCHSAPLRPPLSVAVSCLQASVVVLGATNRREELDDAVLRRFAVQIEVCGGAECGSCVMGPETALTLTPFKAQGAVQAHVKHLASSSPNIST